MRRLTEKQATVLTILALPRHSEVPMTGAEIGEWVFRGQRTKQGVREWAGPALKALEALGFAERMGVAFDGGRCWAATSAGRAALAQREKAGADG